MKFGQLFFTLGASSLAAGNLTVKLDPPQLNDQVIATKIACVRPMREGVFNISTQDIGPKYVVHCYGHGGCGWTTFMGSVDRAIQLFLNRYPSPRTTPPIRVIGSGCMGLCSAIELHRLGYAISGITTEELYNIPSWNAAGYFAVVSVKTSPEDEETVNKINFFTFREYQKVERGTHPYLSAAAVRFLPVYCSQDTHAGLEELEEVGMIPPREIVDLDFGNGVVHKSFKKFMTYFFDVTTLMADLHKEVSRFGIPIEVKKIDDFSEVVEDVIFNCTGLGGKDLVKDSKMIPVRGHLVLLSEDAGKGHMDYMIYSKVKQKGQEEYVYLFPRTRFITSQNPAGTACAGVMGGTFIPNVEDLPSEELAELDRRELQRLLDRNAEFFYGTPYVN